MEDNKKIPAEVPAVKPPKKKRKKSGAFGRFLRRTLLVLFTVLLLGAGGLVMVLHTILTGPSDTARDAMTLFLCESALTDWIPGTFLGEETVAQIRSRFIGSPEGAYSDVSRIHVGGQSALNSSDEWENFPDGIRIEKYQGDTYTAHVMIIRDPGLVYLAASDSDSSGSRIHREIGAQDALAAINAGGFLEDISGAVPAGLLITQGQVLPNDNGEQLPYPGFAGFTCDNVLVVAHSMTEAVAQELDIRDGCAYGPVLIMNGIVNESVYQIRSGYNSRTAIGQRADGAVLFLCIDGLLPGSMGGTYRDVIDILVACGAVNACNMAGGFSSAMMYRDSQGLYGQADGYAMISSLSPLLSEPTRIPHFWMVHSAPKEG